MKDKDKYGAKLSFINTLMKVNGKAKRAWFKNDDTQPTAFAWYLKAKMLAPIYWRGMLKGRKCSASPAY